MEAMEPAAASGSAAMKERRRNLFLLEEAEHGIAEVFNIPSWMSL